MEPNPPNLPKQGLGPLAWIGIGCGSIVALGIIAVLVLSVIFGPKLKEMGEEAKTNPTRFTANTMVKASMGQMEFVAEDEAGKRYTVRTKADGKLTTIYWDAATNAPAIVEGDFSAIPAPTAAPPAETPPN